MVENLMEKICKDGRIWGQNNKEAGSHLGIRTINKNVKKGYNVKSAAPKGNKYGLGNKSNLGRKHTKKTKELMRKSHLGVSRKKHSDYAKTKMRKSHIKFMKSGKLKIKETSIEKMIRYGLEKRKINFIPQFPIQYIAIVDFYIPENNIIIQCDGDFWHHSDWAKKHGKEESDKKQNIFLLKMGYTLFRFTEKEIKKSPQECINKIIKQIGVKDE